MENWGSSYCVLFDVIRVERTLYLKQFFFLLNKHRFPCELSFEGFCVLLESF